MPYRLDESTGLINYDEMERTAKLFRPKVLIAGASAYARLYDYQRMREIADQSNAYLLSDIAHISGLVAANAIPSPFEYSDIVTTTTHKSLRGPRGALIFYRKGLRYHDKKGNPVYYDLQDRINQTVFPGLQGGPHNHTIAGLCVALKQAQTQEFKDYQQQVLKNAKALARRLEEHGHSLVTGGTDNHLVLVDLRNHSVDGSRVEKILEEAHIAANKNTVPGDTSALVPSGLRLGTPALTSRGFTEKDFERVADLVHRGVEITKEIKQHAGPKVKDFKETVDGKKWPQVDDLASEVVDFASKFPTIGFDKAEMRYTS